MAQNLNFDRKELREQDILKHKNFDEVLRSYRMVQRPASNTRWIAAASIAAAACLLAFLYFGFLNNSTNHHGNLLSDGNAPVHFNLNDLPKKVQLPLKNYSVPAEHFKVSADQGGNFKTSSGSTISIPAMAFVDEQGKKVEGTIEVSYREFQNPLDFFLSGMPMHQMKDGQPIQTASAGMFELLANKDDKAIYIASSKQIAVDQQSRFSGKCEQMFFNTTSNTWVKEGENDLLAENGKIIVEKETAPVSIDSAGMPVMPRKADKRKYIFDIKVDVSGFPELAEYKGLLFEVNETYQKFDERLYDIKWEQASIKASSVAGNYNLTIGIRDSSVTIMVYPVFANKNYQEAMLVYQEKKELWLANLAKQQKQTNEKKAIKVNANDVALVTTDEPLINYSKLKAKGKRHFEVHKLGVYQSVMAYHPTTMKVVQPRLIDLKGKEIKNVQMFIADRTQNILYNFGSSASIACDQSASLLFWFVTDNGQMGVVSTEAFLALTVNNDRPLIKVQLMDPGKAIGILKETMQI